jgi:hypothetical protein
MTNNFPGLVLLTRKYMTNNFPGLVLLTRKYTTNNFPGLVLLTHKYMTNNFPGLVQTLLDMVFTMAFLSSQCFDTDMFLCVCVVFFFFTINIFNEIFTLVSGKT